MVATTPSHDWLCLDQEISIALLDDESRPVRGRLRAVSASGARLDVKCPLALSQPVQVQWDRLVLLGRTASCAKSRRGYRVNVEVLGVASESLDSLKQWKGLFG
ncbi:MAG: hypothetical protein IPM24_28035 [Bryobacterales bacterium]|nr:hypothetical protein [Bryobacterales bacterium]